MNTLSRRSTNVLMARLVFKHGRGSVRCSSHEESKPPRWARWQDVPDEWVLPSKRMPDNPYYTTDNWKNFKKRQIYYQQFGDKPTYLLRGYPYQFLYWIAGVLFILSAYRATRIFDGHIFNKKNN